MTLPVTVATAAVVAVLILLVAAFTTCVAAPNGLTVPADTAAVCKGAAAAGFVAAIRKSPATAARPRPTKNFVNPVSILGGRPSPGAQGRLMLRAELVVRLARSRAQFALAHPLSFVECQIGDGFQRPNPLIGESSLPRANLRNFMVNSLLAEGSARFISGKTATFASDEGPLVGCAWRIG